MKIQIRRFQPYQKIFFVSLSKRENINTYTLFNINTSKGNEQFCSISQKISTSQI